MSLEIKLIAILALVAGLLFGIRHEIAAHDAAVKAKVDATYAAAQKKADDELRLQQNQAALRYEDWKLAQQPKTITVTKVIHDAIQSSPVWAAEPVPDGVRSAIAAGIAGPAFAASEPVGAVPVQPAASDNQRATGGGIRRGLERVRGLFGAPSGAR